MGQDESVPQNGEFLAFSEGSAKIYFPANKTKEDCFYNPVQQFNRDLTCTIISAYRDLVGKDITIFEAFSASGLRSIRYALECPGVKKVVANDIEQTAFDIISRNIQINGVSDKVVANLGDARQVMANTSEKYDVLDLDPYSTAAPFLDSAIQAAENGALLCITSTDGRTLCGIQPDAAYAWYNCMPLNCGFSHEMGIRTLLTALIANAARYRKSIEPLLCISANFYFRLFVRIFNKPIESKKVSATTDVVLFSRDTNSFWLQPLGEFTTKGKNPIATPATVHLPYTTDPYTGNALKIAGPVYSGPLHNPEFIQKVLDKLSEMSFTETNSRIEGVLNTCMREVDAPFYYNIGDCAGIIKSSCPPRAVILSEIERHGYVTSLSHCEAGSLKTNAPPQVVWDVFRAFYFSEGKKLPEDKESVAYKILSAEPTIETTLEVDENVEARIKLEKKKCRFYNNPEKNFGPKPAANKGSRKSDKKKK